MAGYIYRIGQDRSYTDLDELIVNYVKAIARKVEELMADEKYKHESPEQLSEYLLLATCAYVTDPSIGQSLELFIKGSPDKSMYAFCLDPEHPGYFKLMFIASPKSPVVQWVSIIISSIIVKISPPTIAGQGDPGGVRVLWSTTPECSAAV
jgi:transcription elongation factor SPT6